ncbi:MAG: hypothetical protein ABFD89_09220 [Bryobacteraceae bacterium]
MRGQTACLRDGGPQAKLTAGFRLLASAGDLDLEDQVPIHHYERFVLAGDYCPKRAALIDELVAERRKKS